MTIHLSGLIVRYDSLNVTNRYAEQLISWGIQYHCTLSGIKISNLSYFDHLNGVLKASNQTHWKLVVEILIAQFYNLKLWEKIYGVQTFQQLYSKTSAYLGKIYVSFLERPSVNVTRMLFSYLNIPTIRKRVSFCLKVIFWLRLVVALIF